MVSACALIAPPPKLPATTFNSQVNKQNVTVRYLVCGVGGCLSQRCVIIKHVNTKFFIKLRKIQIKVLGDVGV